MYIEYILNFNLNMKLFWYVFFLIVWLVSDLTYEKTVYMYLSHFVYFNIIKCNINVKYISTDGNTQKCEKMCSDFGYSKYRIGQIPFKSI